MRDDQAILADNYGKESGEIKRATLQDGITSGVVALPFNTNHEHKIDLETSVNRIKEKELYDQPSAKANNVNERSFVYINQKFKTPVVSQLYSSQDLLKETYKSVITNQDELHKKYPLHSKFNPDYYEPKAEKPKGSLKGFYFPQSKTPEKTRVMMINENKREFNINQEGKKVDERNEYVELLKAPLLRPVLTADKKGNDLQWSFAEPTFQKFNRLKNKNLENFPNSHIDGKQFAVHYDNYGFPTPYGYQRSIPQYKFNPEDLINAQNNLKKITSEHNNYELNKFLDRYLKDSLEEQVTNERINAKSNCTFSDCTLKARKQFMHSHINTDPECHCGRKSNVKRIRNEQSNGYETKGSTDKEEFSISTESYASRSSELNDYSDMLTEEMNLKSLIEE